MIFKEQFKARCSGISEISPDSDKITLTCRNHVFAWMKKQPEFYNKSQGFSSKYTEKGLKCENEGIEFAAKFFGWGDVDKNTTRIENDFLTGECDILLPKTVEDIKNSWDQNTFPIFESTIPVKGYSDQLQGYMELYNRNAAGLVYVLMDAPEYMIEREARKIAYDLGMDDLEEELYQEVKKTMTFSDVPDFLRIKRFSLERDHSRMAKVYSKVMKIRKFIDDLPDIQTFINQHKESFFEEIIE